jgi:hypothetical protein
MKKLLLLTTVFTLLLSSCAKYMDDKPGVADSAAINDSLLMLQRGVLTKERLVGIWVRPIATQPGDEGYHLYADGKLKSINMSSIIGDTWQLSGDTLTLFAHTERYPTPTPMVYRIYALSDSTLELVPENAAPNYTEKFKRKNFTMPERFASTFHQEFQGRILPKQTYDHAFTVKTYFDGSVKVNAANEYVKFIVIKDGDAISEGAVREFKGSFPTGKYKVSVQMIQPQNRRSTAQPYRITVQEEEIDK